MLANSKFGALTEDSIPTGSQLKVNTAHSIASKIPIPAARPPVNINGTTLLSPLRKRRPAHSCKPTPINATTTNAIFAQNHQVSPLGPPNFSQSNKGPVISRMRSPPAPMRLKNVSKDHSNSRCSAEATTNRGPTWESAMPPPTPMPTPTKCNHKRMLFNGFFPWQCNPSGVPLTLTPLRILPLNVAPRKATLIRLQPMHRSSWVKNKHAAAVL